MSDKLDQDLDEVLGRHFRACLDGQLGRASAAFQEELAVRRRWRGWLPTGAAVAACLALAWAMFGHREIDNRVVSTGPSPHRAEQFAGAGAAAAAETPVVQSATWSRMLDDGPAVVDGQPVRQLRRKLVEEIEWYDAEDGATVRTTVPQQQIFLIGVQAD